MPTKLQSLKNFSVGSLIKSKGTGADIAKVVAPTNKSDITSYSRERSYKGTEEFDQNFQVADKAVHSDNEVAGAKIIAKHATEAAKNYTEIVKSKLEIEQARTNWYKADQELIRGQSEGSLTRFQEKLETQKKLDSQSFQYANSVRKYAIEHQGALNVLAQLDKVESKMKL